MFSKRIAQAALMQKRMLSASAVAKSKLQPKVAVLGAAGGIGQPLSMLLKLDARVQHLSLYDIRGTIGVAADLSHIPKPAKVQGFEGPEQLAQALQDCDIVVIPAGVPRKPGMTRDDLFNTNASIVQGLARACAQHCPKAHILVIANPVNSTVPIVAETLRAAGVYDPKRVFGVTTLDLERARTFTSDLKKVDVTSIKVPVIGGHAGKTIIPLLSQNNANLSFSDEETAALTHRIQFGGDEVVQAKAGAGSATLSMAVAGANFTLQLLSALSGQSNVYDYAYVQQSSSSLPSFFSSRILLGPNGVEKIFEIGPVNTFEQKLIDAAIPELETSIKNGLDFAKSH